MREYKNHQKSDSLSRGSTIPIQILKQKLRDNNNQNTKYTTSKKMISLTTWKPEEENMLKNLIDGPGKIRWNQISKKLNEEFGQNQYTAKQCRERYVNYVKFGSEKDKLLIWSSEEQKKLFELYEDLGSQWNAIAQLIPRKSENCLKNKFYGTVRKLLRKLNSIGKSAKRIKKNLKYQSLIKPLQATQQNVDLSPELTDFAAVLRKNLIQLLKSDISNIPNDDALQCIDKINRFNLLTRSFAFRKRRPDHKKHLESHVNSSVVIKDQPLSDHAQNKESEFLVESISMKHISLASSQAKSDEQKKLQQNHWSESSIRQFLDEQPNSDFIFNDFEQAPQQKMSLLPELKDYLSQEFSIIQNGKPEEEFDYLL